LRLPFCFPVALIPLLVPNKTPSLFRTLLSFLLIKIITITSFYLFTQQKTASFGTVSTCVSFMRKRQNRRDQNPFLHIGEKRRQPTARLTVSQRPK